MRRLLGRIAQSVGSSIAGLVGMLRARKGATGADALAYWHRRTARVRAWSTHTAARFETPGGARPAHAVEALHPGESAAERAVAKPRRGQPKGASAIGRWYAPRPTPQPERPTSRLPRTAAEPVAVTRVKLRKDGVAAATAPPQRTGLPSAPEPRQVRAQSGEPVPVPQLSRPASAVPVQAAVSRAESEPPMVVRMPDWPELPPRLPPRHAGRSAPPAALAGVADGPQWNA